MAGFAINVTEAYAVCSGFENTMQRMAQLENRLDAAVSRVGCGSSGRIREKVVVCANKVKDERRDVRALSDNLNEIVGLYSSAEKKVLTEIHPAEISCMQEILDWLSSSGFADSEGGGYKVQRKEFGLLSLIMPMPMSEMLIDLYKDARESGVFFGNMSEKSEELKQKDYGGKYDFFISDFLKTYVDLIKEGTKPIRDTEDVISWFSQEDVDTPLLKYMFKGMKLVDSGIGLVRGTEDYVSGMINGDKDTLAEGMKTLVKTISKIVEKDILPDNVFAPDILNLPKLGYEYATNVVTGLIEGLTAEDPSVEHVIYETFIDSGLNVALDAVQEAANAGIAIIYQPISWVADKFGFDLDAIYEKTSDKEGIFAVYDNVSQFVEMIKENSSWEKWTSGLKDMGESIGNGFKKLFS